MENEKTDENKPDYLKKIFKAIEEANQEMKKYGMCLAWEFKLTPYLGRVYPISPKKRQSGV